MCNPGSRYATFPGSGREPNAGLGGLDRARGVLRCARASSARIGRGFRRDFGLNLREKLGVKLAVSLQCVGPGKHSAREGTDADKQNILSRRYMFRSCGPLDFASPNQGIAVKGAIGRDIAKMRESGSTARLPRIRYHHGIYQYEWRIDAGAGIKQYWGGGGAADGLRLGVHVSTRPGPGSSRCRGRATANPLKK